MPIPAIRDRVRRRFEQAERRSRVDNIRAPAVDPARESERGACDDAEPERDAERDDLPEAALAAPKKSHHRASKRPYRRSGLYRFQLHPDDQAVIDELRAALVADAGGADSLSTARRLLIDIAATQAIKVHTSIAI